MQAASLLAGLVLLTIGAEGLVRGAASLARRLGLSPLVIGLTVVAFGTSTPELVVSLGAALQGNSGIALGNVVGSNIGNIGLILSGAALIAPLRVQSQIVRIDIPIMIGVSIVLAGLLLDGRVGRIEGLVLVTGLIAYTAFTVIAARRSAPAAQDAAAEGVPAASSLGRDVLFVAGGLALLMGGAQLLVGAAVTIAEGLGVSQAVIGLTIVGVGTSLPELATSFAAAFRGASDIAIGNVVGSNIFNILGILGTTALVQPLGGAELSWVDSGMMVGLALLILPLARSGFTMKRWEGAVLLLLYAGYLAMLIL